MRAYAGGDMDSFELLFERHRRALCTFLLHRVGDRELAEDLLQDIFLRVIRGRASLGSGSFRPWLYAIARNAVTDSHRRRGVREVVRRESDVAPDDLPAEPVAADPAATPMAGLAAADLRGRIEAALARLPEAQREVFLLRERARLDYEHIAVMTGAGVATVKSRMRYALAALRRHLEGLPEAVTE